MNQTQRSFLIKKIQEKVKIRVDILRECIPEPPNFSTYLLHAVLSGTFEIKNTQDLKDLILERALKAKERQDWLNPASYSAFSTKSEIGFKVKEFFIMPDNYQVEYDQYTSEKSRIQNEIADILIQEETLITRIQLASDKTLEKLISEIDDMGDIKLIDTKIRLLN